MESCERQVASARAQNQMPGAWPAVQMCMLGGFGVIYTPERNASAHMVSDGGPTGVLERRGKRGCVGPPPRAQNSYSVTNRRSATGGECAPSHELVLQKMERPQPSKCPLDTD